jgi:hypothetical protein
MRGKWPNANPRLNALWTCAGLVPLSGQQNSAVAGRTIAIANLHTEMWAYMSRMKRRQPQPVNFILTLGLGLGFRLKMDKDRFMVR